MEYLIPEGEEAPQVAESWIARHRAALLVGLAAVVLLAGAIAYPWIAAGIPDSRPVMKAVPGGSATPLTRAAKPLPTPTTAPLGVKKPPPTDSRTTARQEFVWVHVCGAVRRAGVVRLPAGARAFDAVRAAGGLQDGADLDRVNLARRVTDESMLLVPWRGSPPPAEERPAIESAPLDLNEADEGMFAALPGIGPTLARAIVADRRKRGPFRVVADLGRVAGIGPRLLSRLTPLVTVAGVAAEPSEPEPVEGALQPSSN